MTTIFDHPEYDDHQQVVFCNDNHTGLRAIIAIHNTDLGPSLGGCRMYPYANETEAVTDVLRLSRGMTYKSAITGLPLGGGKSVIVGDPRQDKHRALMHRMGEFVESLGGSYIVAEDSGTTQEDMKVISTATRFAAGVSGDPSPFTARGTCRGIMAAVKHRYGRNDLEGIKVAIQGLGNVGRHLADLLHDSGASLWVSDVSTEKTARIADELGATIVHPEAIIDQDVDVFAPCAMGAIINEDTVQRLRATVIAGAANNQLAHEHHGLTLHQRGILYAPDYVINAGGVIAVWYEYSNADPDGLTSDVDRIYSTLMEIFEHAKIQRQPTNSIANQIALSRLHGGPGANPVEKIAV